MKSFLKINLMLCLLVSVSAVQAQVDIKINPVGLIFSRAIVSAEFGVKDNIGIKYTAVWGGPPFQSVTRNSKAILSDMV